jgi:HK97 family phage major capsid protein
MHSVLHDQSAGERLQRHAAEMENRAAPSRTPGQGGFFAPPLWLNQQFATAPRPKRVLAELIPGFPLPAGAQSINLPIITKNNGTATRPQVDDGQVADGDILDAPGSSRVATITGEADVPLQLLEQSPAGAHLDFALFKDLTEDYDAQLEYQLLFGTGTGSPTVDYQLQGIATMAGINNQVFTSATPSFSAGTVGNNLYPFMGQAAAQIGDLRRLPPEAWLTTTSRWSWVATSVDNGNRPIVPPDLHPPVHDGTGGPEAVSADLGWPVFCDDAIPTTLGAGANQDVIIVCRPSDLLLFEAEPRNAVLTEVLSGTLGARIQLRNYVAAITNRYPSGVAVISGTGLVVQSGF